MAGPSIVLDGESLTREQLVAIARGAPVRVDEGSLLQVNSAAAYLDQQVKSGRVIYGVTTGFGRNADRFLEGSEAFVSLQRKLLISHAVGVGKPLDKMMVRALMALRLNTLLRGHSGIRAETLTLLQGMLNQGVHPVVPEKGSVGASGDLAPLSHMGLVLLGLGEAEYQGDQLAGAEALKRAGLEPVQLSYKEGLAISNGTSLMAAYGVLCLERMRGLWKTAELAAAITLEGVAGRSAAFDPRVMELRGHAGQVAAARCIRQLIAGSTLVDIPADLVPRKGGDWSLRDGSVLGGKPTRPQDSYSLRCIPQVHGAVRQVIEHVGSVLDHEINAVTDNPIILPAENSVISAGNFHGMPVALALSYLKSSLPVLASISERRLAKLMDASQSDGLPSFLCRHDDGTNSGFMLVQYTAAALVNDLATRSMPATAYSIPTSSNAEDHVSMGANEGRHVYEMLDDLELVLGLEILAAAQAVDLRCKILAGDVWPPPKKAPAAQKHQSMTRIDNQPGPAVRQVMQLIRVRVPFLEEDRELRFDLAAIHELVSSGQLVAAAEAAVGELW